MSIYTAGVRTPAAAAGAAYAALRAAATDRLKLREVGVALSAATATSVGLIRAATVGTASSSTLGQAGDPGDPVGTGNVDIGWSVAPTIGAIYLRRFALPATQGAGFIWTWAPGELVIPVSASILLWNFGGAAGAALDAYFVWDE